ncbi:MMPL family transporter [Halovenus salina]|uniref:MMPL family transporter n=1 Tax=Halovenus salina TaxID=1510225 RepID=A0ABD5W7Z4_9EURY
MIQRFLRRAAGFVTEHNVIVLLVMVLLTGGIMAGIPQLNTSSQSGGTASQFDDIDRVQKSQYIDDAYSKAVVKGSTREVEPVYVWNEDGNALSKESLLAGLRYQQRVTENETVQAALHDDGVRGIENLVATQSAGSSASLDDQIQALESMSEAEVETAIGQLLDENPQAGQFLPADHEGTTSSDRRTLVVLDTAGDSPQEDAETVLYETATEYEDDGFFVLSSNAYSEASSHFFGEMVELVLPITLALILFILAFAYRDLVDVVVGMAGVILSVLWTFGLLGWLGVEAGVIMIIPVVLIAGLSIDFGFHVFNRYREERGPGEGIRKPMARGLSLVATALILVTATAAIGFLANLANPLPSIRDIGITVTLGVVSALGIFVTAVPALKVSIDRTFERIGLDRRKARWDTARICGRCSKKRSPSPGAGLPSCWCSRYSLPLGAVWPGHSSTKRATSRPTATSQSGNSNCQSRWAGSRPRYSHSNATSGRSTSLQTPTTPSNPRYSSKTT